MLKLVLDVNTILSGLLWSGNEFELLQRIERGKARLFVSEEILKELYQVLNYARIQKYIGKAGLTIEQLYGKIVSFSHLAIAHKLDIKVCKDPKDNIFLECAVNAKADYLISGDNDLLSLKEYKNIKIVRTLDILKLI